MIKIRPSSLRGVDHVQPALTTASRSLGVLILLAGSAGGCRFDVTPRSVAHDEGGSTSKWQPPSVSRRNRIISQQAADAAVDGSVDAKSPAKISTSRDVAMRGRDADGGSKIADAGQPPQQPVERDSGPSAGNMAGSSSATGAPTVTKPEMQSQCMPGHYKGPFEGPVTFAVGSINMVTGTVRAELVLEPAGASLQVRDGMMVGKDNAGIGMTATWTGSVNCGTKQLENGKHASGAWQNGSTFTGTLEGSYSTNPYTVSGKWMVQSEQVPLAGGNGTWSMTLQNSLAP